MRTTCESFKTVRRRREKKVNFTQCLCFYNNIAGMFFFFFFHSTRSKAFKVILSIFVKKTGMTRLYSEKNS